MEIIEKMPDNKRHAILLSGLARNYEDTIGDFKKNLRNRDDVDLFICFWDYLGVRKFEKDHSIKKVDGSSQVVCKDRDAGMLDVKKVERDYNPTAIKIYDLDYITSIIEPLARIIEDTKATPKGLKSHYQITRDALMFFMFRQVFSLMEDFENKRGFKYSNVVRARTDFVQGGFYPKIDWDRDYSDAIYAGNWNWSGGTKWTQKQYTFNDHFAISSRKNMSHYFNFYNDMFTVTRKFITNELGSTNKEGTSTKAWSPEHMLSIYFSERNIDCKPIK